MGQKLKKVKNKLLAIKSKKKGKVGFDKLSGGESNFDANYNWFYYYKQGN